MRPNYNNTIWTLVKNITRHVIFPDIGARVVLLWKIHIGVDVLDVVGPVEMHFPYSYDRFITSRHIGSVSVLPSLLFTRFCLALNELVLSRPPTFFLSLFLTLIFYLLILSFKETYFCTFYFRPVMFVSFYFLMSRYIVRAFQVGYQTCG